MAKKRLDDDPDVAEPEVKSHDVVDRFEYDVAFNMAFVGVGQGGGRVAETFFHLGYGRVGVINTAHTDLAEIDDDIPKLDLRMGGAGKDPEIGARAVRGQEGAVYELLTRAIGKSPDYIMVCAGLGGGTGSGACVPIFDICRKYMKECDRSEQRVGAIVSLPHPGEGPTQSKNAVRAFEKLHSRGISPLLIIDNKRIGEKFKTGIDKFYGMANEQVARLLHLFNRLAAQHSNLITFDRADFGTLMDSGICGFGASTVEKYNNAADISEAVRTHLSDNVLVEVDYSKGTKAGCLFMGNDKILSEVPMEFFDGGFGMLNRLLAPDNMVHRGVYRHKKPVLRCYTMLGGLPLPLERLTRLAEAGFVKQDQTIGQFLGIE